MHHQVTLSIQCLDFWVTRREHQNCFPSDTIINHVQVRMSQKVSFFGRRIHLRIVASNLWFHGNFSSACKSETTESPSKIWQAYFSILRNQGRNCLVLTDWSTVSNSKSFRTFQSNILIITTLFIINACFTIICDKKVQPIFYVDHRVG